MKKKEKQVTLSSKVYETVKEKIISGEIAQGSKITEDGLSKEFGISRGPLREALRQLESDRLINRIPHAGIRVVTLTRDLMKDVYVMREALEGMSARLAAENMTEKEVEELFSLLNTHEKEIHKEQGKLYFQNEGDLDFHYKIAEASNNNWLRDLLTGELYQLLRVSRHQTSQIPNRPHKALAEHRNIAVAIENRDPELAEILMRRHISGAWKQVEQFLLSLEHQEQENTNLSSINKQCH